MSKSKGEFLTVSLLEQKGYDPLAYRYFCLQSHYRKALVFTWENLDNAAAAYTKLIARIAALDPADGPVDQEAMKPYREKFGQQMGNDLNTSMGVTALFDVLKTKTNDATKLALIGDFDSVLSPGVCWRRRRPSGGGRPGQDHPNRERLHRHRRGGPGHRRAGAGAVRGEEGEELRGGGPHPG